MLLYRFDCPNLVRKKFISVSRYLKSIHSGKKYKNIQGLHGLNKSTIVC